MTARTRLYVVRHGEVEGAGTSRYNGHADVALSDYGLAQYEGLKEHFAGVKINACYCSDLSRCIQGAELLGSHLGVKPVQKRELRELNIGVWERMTWTELMEKYPVEWQARLDDIVNFQVPQGESLLDLNDRVMPVVNDIVQRHIGENVLLIAHGGVNRVILLNAICAPLASFYNIEQNYCAFNIIDYYADGKAVVKLMNG